MLVGMEAALHAITAMPGAGRYAVTFRRLDGGEQTAVLELRETDVSVAEASLPDEWRPGAPGYPALIEVVRTLDAARSAPAASGAQLRDVAGGWDVMLGNVVLGADGVPHCIAHGALEQADGRYVCTDCGAAALLDGTR